MNFGIKILVLLAALSVAYSASVINKRPRTANPLLKSFFSLPKNHAQAKSNDAPCNEDQFDYCTRNYAKALNLPDFPTDATIFFYYVEHMIIKEGVSGFEKFCKATNEFEDCLGKSFDTCLSVENLVSTVGLDENDAAVYATFAQELKYECGPAYEIFVEHFDCALADAKAKPDQFNYCINAFSNATSEDPSKICDYLQPFTDCIEKIYNCGEDFSAAICGSMKAAFDTTLPQCSVECGQDQISKMTLKKLLRNKRGVRLMRKH